MKKKFVTYFILLVFCLPIAAQNFRVGVTAGTNLHSSTNIDARMGFSIGAKGEYGFNSLDEGWYEDASLLLESHAWKVEFGELGLHLYKSSRQYTTSWYLNLPIHVGYRFPVSQDVKMLFNAGPFVGLGLFGTSKYEIVFMDGGTEKGTIYDNIFTAKDALGRKIQNRFSWGAGLRFGIEVKDKYQFMLGYDRGFNKFSSLFGNSRMNLFSASVAYMF